LLAGGVGAATLTVDDSGGANYTRIQDAVNAKLNVPSEQVPENYQRTGKIWGVKMKTTMIYTMQVEFIRLTKSVFEVNNESSIHSH